MKSTKILLASLLTSVPLFAADPAPSTAGSAINALGIDIIHQLAKPQENIVLSPYSIQAALAMTYAGSAGVTHDEMAKVLHYPANEAEVHQAFADLQKALDAIMQRSLRQAMAHPQGNRLPEDPISLNVANRLFGQQGYAFRDDFLTLVKTSYGAPLEQVDFKKNSEAARKLINDWVDGQTQKRISDLIPEGALTQYSRLVLVNAIYLKAPWLEPFNAQATKPLPFHTKGGAAVDVPTMTQKHSIGYAKRDGYTALAILYRDSALQFLVILPDDVNGLAALEQKLTPEQLSECARLPRQEVILYLPKFKVASPTLPLGDTFKSLGLKTAFNANTADFSRMAPRNPENLYISEVFHKTFMNVDEKGTEAAAATAVSMMAGSAAVRSQEPVTVRVDHPFILAIQHRDTGACLFLGHVVDPR